jgi:hypothetical protein
MSIGAIACFLRTTAVFVVLASAHATAQPQPRLELEVEGGSLWIARNDVQIPNDTGTRFSLADLIEPGPSPLVRVDLTWNIADRHAVRAVYAPLVVERSGIPDRSLLFAGTTFAPGVVTDATYQFSSYRFTYRYRLVHGNRWTWHIGATAFVRDARVALRQGDVAAEDTDVGGVPLAHLRAEARLTDRWSLVFDLDGSAAPQGRAIDFGGRLRYAVNDRLALGVGYRTIEGGADVDQVYNFAWINAVTGSLVVRF